MKPSTPYLRRQALLDWLTGKAVGFSVCDVRKWIKDGVIRKHVFPSARQRKKGSDARAYYAVRQVAEALGIENPLSPANHQTPHSS